MVSQTGLAQLAEVAMSQQQIITLQKGKEALLRQLSGSPYVKGLQQKFLATIFPIGGSLINAAYNLYNATPPIMTEQQRNKLMDIGERISSLPKKMLSGEFDLQKGYVAFVGILKDLTDFVTDTANLNIVVNIGSLLLESIHPIGAFIKNAVGDIMKEGLPKTAEQGLIRGLGAIATNYDKLEIGIQKAATTKLNEVQQGQGRPH